MKQKGAFSSFIIKMGIIATSLSVAVMILSVCVVGGFKSVIRDKIYSFWGHVLVVPYNDNPANIIAEKPVAYSSSVVSMIQADANVKSVSRFALRPAILQFKGQMEGLKLKGISQDYIIPTSLNLKGNQLNYSDTSYSREIIISKTTANKLFLHIGDDVLLYFLETGSTMPRIRKLKIAGLYHTGMEDVDQYFGICDIRLLQHINNWTADQINGYQITAKNEDFAPAIADRIFKNSELSTETITDIYPGIIDWLNVQDLTVRVLLIIMSIVATISLGAALLILIVERANITGLLKALGLNNGSTQKIFLYIALLTGGLGVLFGNIFAIGICLAQQKYGFLKMTESTYFMDTVPMSINIGYILLVDIATILITVICMWLPTLYVRRMQPAKVLQFK
ncbi:MAG: FtsX-like permease family protein [Chitinophagaceae bacterium]|jgi:lipoprotein-releasing system permease protein